MLAVLLATISLSASPVHVVIWGGGKTPESAQQSLAEWGARSAEWSTWLRLQTGYPRIVESAKVPGMNPGFHVVVLGACNEIEIVATMNVLKTLESSAYEKAATWPEEACPVFEMKTVSPIAELKLPTGKLRVVVLGDLLKSDEGAGLSRQLVVTRFEPKGFAAEVAIFRNEDCGGGTPKGAGKGVSFLSTCVTGRCTSWGFSEFRFSYDVKANKVEQQSKETKVISKMTCD
jgi:hypothetical protein